MTPAEAEKPMFNGAERCIFVHAQADDDGVLRDCVILGREETERWHSHARLRAAAQAVVDEWESATSTTVDRAIVVNALAAELEGGSE